MKKMNDMAKLSALTSDLTFKSLSQEDLPLLHEWLNRPHMRDYYQKAPITLAEVEAKFLPRIRKQFPTHDHLALYSGKPIGKIQCYKNVDHPDYADEIDLHEGISVDLFIGEPEMLGHGIGRAMLRQYVEEIAFPLYPDESKCFICHELTNVRARKCSVAAGFESVRKVSEAGVPSELLVFVKPPLCGPIKEPFEEKLSLLHYIRKWDLREPLLLTKTATSVLYKVLWNGAPAVLKLLTPLGQLDESGGAAALEYFGGNSSVILYRSDDKAQLLEYIEGENLKSVVERGEDEKATLIISNILNMLHKTQGKPIPEQLTPLKIRFRSLFKKSEKDKKEGIVSLYTKAAEVAELLLSAQSDKRVLHGDMHHENLKFSEKRGWLAIDPKGLHGERTFDAANTLCNPLGMDDLVVNEARLMKNAQILAENLGLNIKRLLAFTFAYAGLSASWSLEDNQNPSVALKVAQLLEKHISATDINVFPIRRAAEEDAAVILDVHCAAVHGTASEFYDQNILNDWSPIPVPLERIRDLAARIKSGEEIMLVAENLMGQIVGFGSIFPDQSELRAVYTHPNYGKQGLGGRLLKAVEDLAKETGLHELSMDASINAEKFYLSHGYQIIERGEHVLRSGRRMACIKMKKILEKSNVTD